MPFVKTFRKMFLNFPKCSTFRTHFKNAMVCFFLSKTALENKLVKGEGGRGIGWLSAVYTLCFVMTWNFNFDSNF